MLPNDRRADETKRPYIAQYIKRQSGVQKIPLFRRTALMMIDIRIAPFIHSLVPVRGTFPIVWHAAPVCKLCFD